MKPGAENIGSIDNAGMVESVYTADLKSAAHKGMRVRVPLSAPKNT